MKNSNQALWLILYLLDDNRHELPAKIATNMQDVKLWTEAIHIADRNGVLYSFCERALEYELPLPEKLERKLVLLLKKERQNFPMLKKTLDFVSDFLKDRGFQFLFIKLYRGVTYVPRDIDVMIRQNEADQITSSFKLEGFQVSTSDNVESTCFKNGYMKLDLYQGFSYFSLPFIDTEFVWKEHRMSTICDTDCPIPSVNADLLILCIHALLGHRYLSLLDFLYARSLLKGFNKIPNEILSQTDKYGWTQAFLTMLSTTKDLDEKLFLDSNGKRKITFPMQFTARYLLQAFGGFVNLPVGTQRKLIFIASTLVDNAMIKYQLLSSSHSVEVEGRMKEILQKSIYKIRYLVGDSKMYK